MYLHDTFPMVERAAMKHRVEIVPHTADLEADETPTIFYAMCWTCDDQVGDYDDYDSVCGARDEHIAEEAEYESERQAEAAAIRHFDNNVNG